MKTYLSIIAIAPLAIVLFGWTVACGIQQCHDNFWVWLFSYFAFVLATAFSCAVFAATRCLWRRARDRAERREP